MDLETKRSVKYSVRSVKYSGYLGPIGCLFSFWASECSDG